MKYIALMIVTLLILGGLLVHLGNQLVKANPALTEADLVTENCSIVYNKNRTIVQKCVFEDDTCYILNRHYDATSISCVDNK